MNAITKLAAKKYLAEGLFYSIAEDMEKEAAWTVDSILAGVKSSGRKATSALKRGAKKVKKKVKGYGDVMVGGPQSRMAAKNKPGGSKGAPGGWTGFPTKKQKQSRKANLAKMDKRTTKYRVATGAGVAGVAGLAALARATSKSGGKGMSKAKLMTMMKQHKGKLIAGGAGATGLAALAAAKR